MLLVLKSFIKKRLTANSTPRIEACLLSTWCAVLMARLLVKACIIKNEKKTKRKAYPKANVRLPVAVRKWFPRVTRIPYALRWRGYIERYNDTVILRTGMTAASSNFAFKIAAKPLQIKAWLLLTAYRTRHRPIKRHNRCTVWPQYVRQTDNVVPKAWSNGRSRTWLKDKDKNVYCLVINYYRLYYYYGHYCCCCQGTYSMFLNASSTTLRQSSSVKVKLDATSSSDRETGSSSCCPCDTISMLPGCFNCVLDLGVAIRWHLQWKSLNLYSPSVVDNTQQNTRCFIKEPLFVFFIIHSNDEQFARNFYQFTYLPCR